MKEKLEKYIKGEIFYTPIQNFFFNTGDRDWYNKVGEYIIETLPVEEMKEFSFLVSRLEKERK